MYGVNHIFAFFCNSKSSDAYKMQSAKLRLTEMSTTYKVQNKIRSVYSHERPTCVTTRIRFLTSHNGQSDTS